MYLWIKAFHIIAVVTWFAALFYLPRLFVYHAQSEDSISRERFKIMERKLYRGIMTPSMLIAVTLGLWMLLATAGMALPRLAACQTGIGRSAGCVPLHLRRHPQAIRGG